jgi:hypothetical protein
MASRPTRCTSSAAPRARTWTPFAFLHAHANHNALRRIERPDLPEEALDVLAKGIARRRPDGRA